PRPAPRAQEQGTHWEQRKHSPAPSDTRGHRVNPSHCRQLRRQGSARLPPPLSPSLSLSLLTFPSFFLFLPRFLSSCHVSLSLSLTALISSVDHVTARYLPHLTLSPSLSLPLSLPLLLPL